MDTCCQPTDTGSSAVRWASSPAHLQAAAGGAAQPPAASVPPPPAHQTRASGRHLRRMKHDLEDGIVPVNWQRTAGCSPWAAPWAGQGATFSALHLVDTCMMCDTILASENWHYACRSARYGTYCSPGMGVSNTCHRAAEGAQ